MFKEQIFFCPNQRAKLEIYIRHQQAILSNCYGPLPSLGQAQGAQAPGGRVHRSPVQGGSSPPLLDPTRQARPACHVRQQPLTSEPAPVHL